MQTADNGTASFISCQIRLLHSLKSYFLLNHLVPLNGSSSKYLKVHYLILRLIAIKMSGKMESSDHKPFTKLSPLLYQYLQIGSLIFVTVVFLTLFAFVFATVFTFWSYKSAHAKPTINSNMTFMLIPLQWLTRINCSLFNISSLEHNIT